MFSRFPVSVSCRPVVAQRIRATGKSRRIPLAIISRAIEPRRSTPINITWVPPSFASALKSIALSIFSGSSWPVKNVTCEFLPRCVTGIPA